jgi:hypothetical protein
MINGRGHAEVDKGYVILQVKGSMTWENAVEVEDNSRVRFG